nr:Wadjet anti-phage system protein JetD domain-containing protein [Bifidobacterium choloepi]
MGKAADRQREHELRAGSKFWRAVGLREAFPDMPDKRVDNIVRRSWREFRTKDDYRRFLTAAQWFATHDWKGLTPRQIPLEGTHAKWLNPSRLSVIAHAIGVPSIDLEDRPGMLVLHYADPEWLDSGGRRDDLWTTRDTGFRLPYRPRIVVICENKDCAQSFPPFDGTVVVEGDGYSASGLLPQVPWLQGARDGVDAATGDDEHRRPLLVYWGDMDEAGYEIVANLRRRGLESVRTILMDPASWQAYAKWGTDIDRRGEKLRPSGRPAPEELTGDERAVWQLIRHEDHGVTRIEQERIPNSAVVDALERL